MLQLAVERARKAVVWELLQQFFGVRLQRLDAKTGANEGD